MPKFRAKKFSNSVYYALNGCRLSFKTQRNFRRHLLIALSCILIAIILRLDLTSLCIVILANSIPLVAEMFNSVCEFLVDLYYKNRWAKIAKMAKDIAAGAVLLSSCVSAIITFLLCLNKIIYIFAS